MWQRNREWPGRSLLQQVVRQVKRSELVDIMVPASPTDVVVGADEVESVVVIGPGGEEPIPTRAVLMATNGFAAVDRRRMTLFF